MKILQKLRITGIKDRIVEFGEADTDVEIDAVYKLRYQVYSEKRYINPERCPDKIERDEYDDGRSRYFIAKLVENDVAKVIGCARVIQDSILPTEIDYDFIEPEFLGGVPANKRFEIGRLIVIPPNRKTHDYLPRGLVMLFLFDVITKYALKQGLIAGYAFIKESLSFKMRSAKIPIHYIENYRLTYSPSGILAPYFNQKSDPVVPVYFVTNEITNYIKKRFSNKILFRITDDCIEYRNNVVTYILKVLKVV